jgi:hypothetical protein
MLDHLHVCYEFEIESLHVPILNCFLKKGHLTISFNNIIFIKGPFIIQNFNFQKTFSTQGLFDMSKNDSKRQKHSCVFWNLEPI